MRDLAIGRLRSVLIVFLVILLVFVILCLFLFLILAFLGASVGRLLVLFFDRCLGL